MVPRQPIRELSVIGLFWLAWARVTPLLTRKSHATTIGACNAVIPNDYPLPDDVFDSHHPLHFQPSLANASQ
jgi:hypothetical protein